MRKLVFLLVGLFLAVPFISPTQAQRYIPERLQNQPRWLSMASTTMPGGTYFVLHLENGFSCSVDADYINIRSHKAYIRVWGPEDSKKATTTQEFFIERPNDSVSAPIVGKSSWTQRREYLYNPFANPKSGTVWVVPEWMKEKRYEVTKLSSGPDLFQECVAYVSVLPPEVRELFRTFVDKK